MSTDSGAGRPDPAVGSALVQACLGGSPELPTGDAAAADFVAAARHHRVAPLAERAVRRARPDVAQRLRPDRDRALLNHLRATALLAGLSRQLDGLSWLVFKGPMLSEFAHPLPGLRFYKDLDVLVGPGELRTACRRLFDAGWSVVMSNESLLAAEFPGEIALVNDQGVVMDLHWSMQVMRSVRGRFPVDAAALLDRRVPVSIGPARLSALHPHDALVHVCQHAALIGGTRLGHVLDADQLARQVDEWEALAERARRWGAGEQVAVVLLRAQSLFSTPIPDDLARILHVSRVMESAMRLLDRRRPIQDLRRDESWVRLATRSLRPSLPRTTAVALHRAAHGSFDRLRRTAPRPPREGADRLAVDLYLSRVEATR